MLVVSLKKASKCVEEDWGAFCEAGYYNFIVIERNVEGLYNIGAFEGVEENEWWYKHDDEKNCWVKCKKPKVLNGLCNFGMG